MFRVGSLHPANVTAKKFRSERFASWRTFSEVSSHLQDATNCAKRSVVRLVEGRGLEELLMMEAHTGSVKKIELCFLAVPGQQMCTYDVCLNVI